MIDDNATILSRLDAEAQSRRDENCGEANSEAVIRAALDDTMAILSKTEVELGCAIAERADAVAERV